MSRMDYVDWQEASDALHSLAENAPADARQVLRDLESELREQASGSQDGYLLDIANRIREALRNI